MIKANNIHVQNKQQAKAPPAVIREKPLNISEVQKNKSINSIKTSKYLEDLTNKGD
jgi:hypothetical protein